MRKSLILIAILTLIAPFAFLGCEGDDGAAGAPGTSTGTVSGTVTNSATGTGLEGATVSTSPDQGTATTAADGSYTLTNLPAGSYTVTFAKTDFGPVTSPVSVLAGVTSTEDATLIPTVPVLVDIAVTGTAAPGETLAATVTPMPLDGSTVTGVEWSQKNSVTVTFDNTTGTTTNVTLPGPGAYKDELIRVVAEPPITPAQLPPNVTAPESFAEQLQDRFGVVGVNHLELEEAGLVTLVATVTTTSGTYESEFEIHASLPWKVNPGLQNVPVGVPVLLHGGTQGGTQSTWDWAVTGPSGAVTLDDGSTATDNNISFTPTATGTYTVTENVSGATFDVVAGNWAGAITGLGTDGRPDAEGCTAAVCHGAGATAADGTPIDKFAEWRVSGHAEIFTNNINAGGHYGEGCFPCHTVGHDTDAANQGIDDQSDYDALIAKYFDDTPGFSSHGSPIGNAGNYADVLASFPNSARLTNIQCENCHGPNSALHINTVLDEERISVASQVCGSCHGEPARHGRFQQWQVSPHSNYELAIDEGDSGNCSRCHTAQGFIEWGNTFGFNQDNNVTVTWTADTVHPQTCVACHPPHDPGNISGGTNNAKVRVENDTPVLAAGFRVLNAGRGAICMVCHNTRRDLVGDDIPTSVITDGRAPHGGAQADVLMGQNAFFVTTGVRGKHSLITDTCSNCHMQKTPPPALLSYNLGGTNHTFFASRDICANCHASITADEVQSATLDQISFLAASIESKLAELITAYSATDNVTLTNVTDPVTGAVSPLDNVTIAPTDIVTVANYGDSHGRQAVDVTVNGVTGHVQLRHILVNTTFTIITFNASVPAGNGPGELLAKAGWNYLMATNERSNGIHNPTFSLQILSGAQTAVDGIVP